MKNIKTILLLGLIIFVGTTQTGCSQEEGVQFATETITIQTPASKAINLTVEMALTKEQQQQGLMFRKSMKDDHGMLFIFPTVRQTGFWMKNTLIPLDMAFIDEQGIVVHIHPMAIPEDLTNIPSRYPVKAVLEINGGLADKIGLTEGSRVSHPAFGT